MTPRPDPKRPDDLETAIVAELKRLRVEAGVTQVQAAAVIGVTFQQIQKYEGGSNRLSIGRFVALVTALGADPSAVLQHVMKQGERQERAG